MNVVPTFDEVKNRGARFVPVRKLSTREKLTLERRVEALRHRVVVAITYCTHRNANAKLIASNLEVNRRVLRTLVGVVNNVPGSPTLNGRFERLKHEFGPHMIFKRPPHDSATPYV